MAAGASLWSERLFSEDTNTVSKLFCINLLYVSSYLLSTGVFMSVWVVYRSVIAYRSQVISPGDVPSYISELCIVTTFMLYKSSQFMCGLKWSQPPSHVGEIRFSLRCF